MHTAIAPPANNKAANIHENFRQGFTAAYSRVTQRAVNGKAASPMTA
jgi:hypothetical protein